MERTKEEKQKFIASYRELLNSKLASAETGLYYGIGLARVKVMQYGGPPSELMDREEKEIREYNDKVNYYCQWYNDEMKRLQINDFVKPPDPIPLDKFHGLPVPPHTWNGRHYDWDERALTEVKKQRAEAEAEAKKRAKAEAEAREEQSRIAAAAAGWAYEERRRQRRK